MKRALAALMAAPLLLTACNTQPAEPATQAAPESLEYDTETNAGIDSTRHQPTDQAIPCNERPVHTTDGYVSLKNVELEDGEIHYYFAPNGSVYNSYIYNVKFDNGEIVVRDASNDAFEAEYRAIPGTDWKPLDISLGSSFYGQNFAIPSHVFSELGEVKTAAASVNGENAGTCWFD